MSNNTNNTGADTTDDGNELVYTGVFIILFLPPLIMLLVQIQRTLSYQIHRKFFHKLLWVKFSDATIEQRINIHILVKISFAFICLVRIVQALIFVAVVMVPGPNLDLDSVVRYWIPYICMNLMFTALSFLIYYWVELGLINYDQLGKSRVIPMRFTISFIVINIIFHTLTLIILPIYIKPSLDNTTPEGNASAKLFRTIYLFAVNVPMLILAILGLIYVKFTLKRLGSKLNLSANETTKISKASRRIEIFAIVTAVMFAIRIILNSFSIFVDVSSNVDLFATLEFFWNSIPEVSLSYAVLWLLWIKRSLVKAKAYQELPIDVVAPELTEEPKQVELESQN